MPLNLEERIVFEFAHEWRDENYRPDLGGIDWPRFAKLITHNRMAVLALLILKRNKISIPAEAKKELQEQAGKYKRSTSQLGEALVTYLKSAESHNIKTIVLKGLWLCEQVYQVPHIRPGADIDILVPKNKVEACLQTLEEGGIGEFWPNLLKDEYFTRHHLHQQRSNPDLSIWFEIHWAFDHPYTLLTVDYNSIFERARASTLLGAPFHEMSPPDLILSLAIHLVKHAYYLPSLLDFETLPRIILADGMLMYFLDILEVLKQNQNFEWDLTIQLAREWGAVDILGSVLQTCTRYLNAPIPEQVLLALPVASPRRFVQKGMAATADQKLAEFENRPVNRFWHMLMASNGAFILRPIRILETSAYLFPPADFLRRRYAGSNLLTSVAHFLRALKNSILFGWDTLTFGLERFFRLKRLRLRTSLSNKLDTPL